MKREERSIAFWFLAVLISFGVYQTCVALADGEAAPLVTDVHSPQFNGLVSILLGAGISWAVAALKQVPWVAGNPKLVATILSVLVSLLVAYLGVRGSQPFWAYAVYTVTQLAVAIGTHEVVTKPIQQELIETDSGIDGDPNESEHE